MIRPRLTLRRWPPSLRQRSAGRRRERAPDAVGPIAFWDFWHGPGLTVFANGSDLRQLTHTDANRIARGPAWSPDGQWIIYTRLRINQPDDHARIWIMRSDGSDQHQLRVRPYRLSRLHRVVHARRALDRILPLPTERRRLLDRADAVGWSTASR